jgi:hypothetical protein
VLVACAIFTILGTLALSPAPQAGALDGYGQDWLAKINDLRTGQGLAPLQLDPELTGLAQGWAQHMADTGILSHTPDLTANVSTSWTKLGENVGYGPKNDLIWIGFLNSPKHYANLVDPAYTHVGIGVAFRGGTEFVAHRFMAAGSVSRGGGTTTYVAPSQPAPRRSSPPATTAPVPEAPPAPEPAPTPPPPVADTGRVAAVLDALHAAGT